MNPLIDGLLWALEQERETAEKAHESDTNHGTYRWQQRLTDDALSALRRRFEDLEDFYESQGDYYIEHGYLPFFRADD